LQPNAALACLKRESNQSGFSLALNHLTSVVAELVPATSRFEDMKT
jgi:hypothetical protein